jgi:hypothetical protein
MAQSTVTQIRVLADFAAETAQMIGQVHVGNSDRLELLRKMRSDVEALERLTVKECRNCDWTWQDVGDALGITRQAAQQRFGN